MTAKYQDLGEPGDIMATTLADQLGISVSRMLFRVETVLEETKEKGGIEAIRGMTTRTRAGRMWISPQLAAGLRQYDHERDIRAKARMR